MAAHDHAHDHDCGHDHDHSHDCGHDHDHAHDHGAAEDYADWVVSVVDAGPARKKISVEIPADRIASKLADNFDSLQDEAVIPGFRVGHVPMRLLQKRFGREVRREARNQLVGEGYTHAVQKHSLRVLGEPEFGDLEQLELPDAGPLSFHLEVEVAPEIELPDLKGFEVKKPLFQVADEQVDAELARYGEMYGKYVSAEAAGFDDVVTADVKATSDEGDDKGEVLLEVSGQGILVAGEKRKFKGAVAGVLVDNLGKELEGRKIGEKLSVKAKGQGQHENAKLRDKALNIEITLTGIERLQPLAVAELTQTLGYSDEKALRDEVKQALEGRVEGQQRQAMSDQVVEGLLEKVKIGELPEKLSETQAARVLRRRAIEMMQQGVSAADIEQNLAELRDSSKEQAQRDLRLLFVFDAVARKFELEVSEAEINGRVVQMAMQMGKRPERLREELARSDRLEQLYLQVREQKAIDQILKDAKVVDISADEWKKLRGEADAAKETKKKSAGSKSKKAEKPAEAKAEEPAPKKKSSKKKED